MPKAEELSPVKLIVGAIFTSEGILMEAKQNLKRKFGPVDFESQIIPFDFTEYYKKEMGPVLLRQFFSFQRLIRPQQLVAIKLFTTRLERRFSRSRTFPSRRINLDPGYVSSAKLVLATGKNYAHRIYLGRGIFAEVTLQFRRGSFQPWPWTYPDYQTPAYIQSFNAIRKIYLRQLSGRHNFI